MAHIDLLTRIKNAQAVKKEKLKAPFSQMDMKVAEILVRRGFIKSVEKKGRMPKRIIDIKLRYDDGQRAINGIKLVSKPSRRIYVGYKELRPIKHGYGVSVISTSKGIMTGREARRQKLGGEFLFEIW